MKILSDLRNTKIFRSLTPARTDSVDYRKRDHSSRAAARDRRFAETDMIGVGAYGSKAPMSLVSLPLNIRGTPSKAVPVQVRI